MLLFLPSGRSRHPDQALGHQGGHSGKEELPRCASSGLPLALRPQREEVPPPLPHPEKQSPCLEQNKDPCPTQVIEEGVHGHQKLHGCTAPLGHYEMSIRHLGDKACERDGATDGVGGTVSRQDGQTRRQKRVQARCSRVKPPRREDVNSLREQVDLLRRQPLNLLPLSLELQGSDLFLLPVGRSFLGCLPNTLQERKRHPQEREAPAADLD
mmetsp:Transcript_4800/g.9640  ORF Transcript_4800/g.9640 Transcript_4800/m.9640 type:complete len:212 (+) Transcript_4800:232-867(+)